MNRATGVVLGLAFMGLTLASCGSRDVSEDAARTLDAIEDDPAKLGAVLAVAVDFEQLQERKDRAAHDWNGTKHGAPIGWYETGENHDRLNRFR